MGVQTYKLADHIVFDVREQTFTIDGEPFPWYVLKNDARIIMEDDKMVGLQVTILADKSATVVDPSADA